MAEFIVTSDTGITAIIETSEGANYVIEPAASVQYIVDNARQGPIGVGLPSGGTTSQYLRKASTTDYDFEWDSLDKNDVGLSNVDNVQQQPMDAELTAIAGLTSAVDKGIQFTGLGTAGTYDLTTAGKALLDDANAAAQRTTLGLAIGTDVQAYDPDLDTIAALTATTDNFMVATSSAWASRTPTQARSQMGLGSLATLSTINGSNWSGQDLAVADGGTGASDSSTARTNLGVAIGTDVMAFAANNATSSSTNTFTNKTVDANGTGNSISNLEVADLAAGVLDTDLSSVSGSDDTVPSAKATKTALDLKASIASPTFTGTVTLPTGLTGVIRADSGVTSVDTDVTDIVTASSDVLAGKVELATTAETTTGTDATRAVTPDGLHDMTSLAGAAWFLDEDNMASDSATKVPSQQSTKAYVDAQIIASGTGDVVGPSSSVDSEVVLFNSTTGKLIKRASASGIAHLASGVLTGSNVLESEITLADNATNNSSTSNHGFLKKLSNTATDFMNGAGNWTTPEPVVKTQVFTTSGTYTPDANMKYCIIEAVGGGGAGGSAAGATNDMRCASGGGSGGYSRSVKTAANIGASQTVTIGAGGTAGSTGDNPGNAGGDTSVGVLVVGKGGAGGLARSLSTAGGAGGVAGTGDITIVGNKGQPGPFNGTSLLFAITGGSGAPSYFGGAISGALHTSTQTGAAGTSGAGGQGGSVYNTASNVAGGAGGNGLVIITEFCSK